MNNDSAPPPAEDSLPPTSASENASSENAPSTAVLLEQGSQVAPGQTPPLKKCEAQFQKKYEFISTLMTNLDVLIYLELSILYYMDCSLIRFLLRIAPQMIFLTPKPSFMPALPQSRPYIGAIFGPNIICALLHIFTSRPEAGEAMRGYLHGGVIIDLIGYKGPTSKLHLLLLDLLVLVLQCVMLAVHVEMEMVSVVLAAVRRSPSSGDQPRVEVVSAQNHDAEEQGVMREGVLDNGDIEMRAMAPRSDGPSTSNEAERSADDDHAHLLEEPAPRDGAAQDNILDVMWSGSVILSDFHVVSTIQRQWALYRSATASGSTLQSMGFSNELAALRANRRLNAASQRIQRGVEALGG